MAQPPTPADADHDATPGVADLLQDAIIDLPGAEATLAQLTPSGPPAKTLAAVRAALGELRTVAS